MGLSLTGPSSGGGGGGDKEFEYTQAIPASTWTVNHNLNKYPAVMVVDTSNIEMFGTVQFISKNTVIITFSDPTEGKAFFS